MNRFDKRQDHDDTRYPGDEFGGTYGYRDARDFGGTPYEARHDQPPGHRDFGGHHGYDTQGQHPGHRDFGRGEAPSTATRGARRWHGSGYPGGYRGMGPGDYERADERIREDVCERLTDHDAIDASNIDVRVSAGVVQLSGDVPERYMKHRQKTPWSTRSASRTSRTACASGVACAGANRAVSVVCSTSLRLADGLAQGQTARCPLASLMAISSWCALYGLRTSGAW